MSFDLRYLLHLTIIPLIRLSVSSFLFFHFFTELLSFKIIPFRPRKSPWWCNRISLSADLLLLNLYCLLSPLAITTIEANPILCVLVAIHSFFSARLPKTISLSTVGFVCPEVLVKMMEWVTLQMQWSLLWRPCDGQAGRLWPFLDLEPERSFLFPFCSPVKAVFLGEREQAVSLVSWVPRLPSSFSGATWKPIGRVCPLRSWCNNHRMSPGALQEKGLSFLGLCSDSYLLSFPILKF